MATAAPADSSPLRDTRAGVDIDWGEGTLTAQGGAAADLRMPSAELARPGAVRRARAAALAKLRGALSELPLGGTRTLPAAAVERALGRARPGRVEYQSNGGALAEATVRFVDWIEGAPAPASPPPDAAAPTPAPAPPPPVAVLSVAAMHLAAAPLVKLGGHEVPLGAATYRVGAAPAAANALPARIDKGGRLLLSADPDLAQKFAHAVVVIYVQKVLR